ncbi:MAG: primosomal protein N' [Deltaproteobacteria bacterium]|jgi:primosomal protein N' (replication factor Y)|nr:primosomal protein N' [Deltaproteobacteria bacterium]
MASEKKDNVTNLDLDSQPIYLVAVNSPVPDYFSYLGPPDREVEVGQMVKVPLSGREVLGYVMGLDDRGPASKRKYRLLPIREIVVAEPLFGPELVKLVDFISNYYLYPPGLCVKEILPGGLSPKLKVSYRLTPKGLEKIQKNFPGALGPAGSDGPQGALGGSPPETVTQAVFEAAPSDWVPPVPLEELTGDNHGRPLGDKAGGHGPAMAGAPARGHKTAPLPQGVEDGLLRLMAAGYPDDLPSIKLGMAGPQLRKYTKAGLIEAVYEIEGRGKGFAYEYFLSPLERPEVMPRLGPREKELYDLVKDAPPTPLSHYRQIFDFDPMVQAKNLKRKGLVAIESRERFRDDPSRAIVLPIQEVESLTPDQLVAVGAINKALEGSDPSGFLLFGVTGSGKTEVYLRAAEKALTMGKGVLWLAPEIALTMGLEGRLRERFPSEALSILHSALTPGQRHDHWLALRRGRTRLALGARSAVFAPIADLGLIIVDEEHDWAYKQDDGLRYHGRDLAAWRAQASAAVLVLGSATPSLESYHRAKTGKLNLLKLQSRPGLAVMPEVKIIDLRREGRYKGPIASQVSTGLKETFDRKEQALMFINRKGLANLPMCLSCGEVLKCPHCSLSLTLHVNSDKFDRRVRDYVPPPAPKSAGPKSGPNPGPTPGLAEGLGQNPGPAEGLGQNQGPSQPESPGLNPDQGLNGNGAQNGPESPDQIQGESGIEGHGDEVSKLNPDNLLICHGCGYRARPPKACPRCKSSLVRYRGVGTESLIVEMERSFGKKGLRLDTDSAKVKGGFKAILEGFAKGEADFLVGTQMAAKGHDFSNLTMVGVVEADIGLNLADFRAAERTFQLLSQVSGRAGRRERPGTVYIQTRSPDHYSMTSVQNHDYESFYENEIAIRQELGYPPFSRIALLRFSGHEDKKVEELAQWAADRGRRLVSAKMPEQIEVFGPAPCPISKLRDKFRHQILIRADKAEDRHRLLRKLIPEVRKKLSNAMGLVVDVDPYSLL